MPSETEKRGTWVVAVSWILALAAAVPLVSTALGAIRSVEVPPSQAFYDYNSVRVDEFATQINGGATGIVVVGDSRVRYGTVSPEVLAERITTASDHEVAVLRLTHDWATIHDFATLFDEVIAAEPTLVVLQDELRLRERGLDATELLQREYVWWKLFGRGAWEPGERNQFQHQYDVSCDFYEPIDRRLRRVNQWLDYVPDGEAAARIADFVERLDQHEIMVRYLSIPVTEAADALPGVEPTEGPLALGMQERPPDDLFCDLVHFGDEGRELFTDWLATTLAAEIDGIDLGPTPSS